MYGRARAHRRIRPLPAALAAITVLALLPVALAADVGVALDVGRIDVEQRLAKGASYQLPTIGVRNPGTETSTYEMSAGYVERQSQRRPPLDWFTFTPDRFTLEPGATIPIRVALEIPTDAGPDDYYALLRAQVVTEGEGAQVGAAAAAQLTFTVEPSTILEAWLLRGRLALQERSPWSYFILGLGVVAVPAWWLGRRYRFGLRVERRGSR
jgi:hypothetical protein